MNINKWLVKSLGQLSRLWHLLAVALRAASVENSSISVNKVIKLIEQTVVCAGQAFLTLDYQCRLNVLLHFIRNQKIQRHSGRQWCFTKDCYGDLLGSVFCVQLGKKTRNPKRLREAKVAFYGLPPKNVGWTGLFSVDLPRGRESGEAELPIQGHPAVAIPLFIKLAATHYSHHINKFWTLWKGWE